jgi:hypothetical protein
VRDAKKNEVILTRATRSMALTIEGLTERVGARENGRAYHRAYCANVYSVIRTKYERISGKSPLFGFRLD